MSSPHYEHPFNWRLASRGRHSPIFNLLVDPQRVCPHEGVEGLYVFLPQERNYDIITLRNWLHDNIATGYRIIGCFYTDSRLRNVLSGLKFVFTRAVDALYFRIFVSVI